MTHLQILGAKDAMWNMLHTEDPKLWSDWTWYERCDVGG